MKVLAVLLVAALPLFADVIIPEDEKQRPKPAQTDTATTTATTTTTAATTTAATTAEPAPAPTTTTAAPAPAPAKAQAVSPVTRRVVWGSLIGIALIIFIASRRRKTHPAQ